MELVLKCASCVRSRSCPPSVEVILSKVPLVLCPSIAELGRFARRSGLRRQTRTTALTPPGGEVSGPAKPDPGRPLASIGSSASGLALVPFATLAFIAALFGAVLPAAADPVDEDPNGSSLDPDLVAGKKAIEQKNWSAAIKVLSSAALRDTRNADIQNYLGYAYRNAGQMNQAFAHYERALKLNPRHRGAHEYVGEAYLMAGKLAEAEAHLKALQAICLLPCEELDDLKAKIDRYRQEGRKP